MPRLRRDGLRRAGESAKLERALADRLPAPAGRGAADALLRRARWCWPTCGRHAETLKSLDPMVRRDEPDSVHQMRVATRRLRSTLRSFGTIIRRGHPAAAGRAQVARRRARRGP